MRWPFTSATTLTAGPLFPVPQTAKLTTTAKSTALKKKLSVPDLIDSVKDIRLSLQSFDV